MSTSLIQYLKESRDELKKTVWPTRQQTIRNTALVIGASVGMAVFLGVIDAGLTWVVEQLFTR